MASKSEKRAMGRMYAIVMNEIAVSAVQDLIQIHISSADYFTLIHSISISQSSDAGDTASEMLNITIERVFFNGGSGGSAVTPNPLELGDSAYASSVSRNNTTQATSDGIILFSIDLDIMKGYYKQFLPNDKIVMSTDNNSGLDWYFVIVLNTAPIDPLTMNCTVIIEEI